MKHKLDKEKMLQYPIFQLRGGSAVERSACIDAIKSNSRFTHFDIGVAQGGKYLRHDLLLMSLRYDLVLVDAPVDFPLYTIHVGSEHGSDIEELVFLNKEISGGEQFYDGLFNKIESIAAGVPVWACILIGGKSSRMGQPKHLLQGVDGTAESWIERTVHLIKPLVDGLVVSGNGDLPDSLSGITRVPDIPGVAGPLTGVLSAMRWQPNVNWLVIACDMPFVSKEAIQWLLLRQDAGCWGRLPRLADADYCEPLLALYDSRAKQLLEEQLLSGIFRVGRIASHRKIDNPTIPDHLAFAWQNVNTPDQLQSVQLS